jgi:hypothetical protein
MVNGHEANRFTVRFSNEPAKICDPCFPAIKVYHFSTPCKPLLIAVDGSRAFMDSTEKDAIY